jgi:RNA polymerase sigma factor (sigma-70 family)
MSDFGVAPDNSVMHDETDRELLHAFAARGDEAAFAEVVRRWGSLVYGVALRRTGDHGIAEEAAQNVLITLARRAAKLASHPALAAWLQRAAFYEAARAVEKETNRRRLMHDYSEQLTADDQSGGAAWREVAPLLDAAVAALPESDREVILLRYWQGQPFKKIAEVAGVTVAACEKRAERALEKLSRLLRRRGAAISAAALAAGLMPALTKASAAPATLARLTSGALSASKSAPALSTSLITLLLMKSKFAPGIALAILIAMCGTGGWVAGRAGGHADSAAASSVKRAASIPAAGKSAPNPAVKAHRESLRQLLLAARRDLLTAEFDPSAKARAAARISAIAPEDIRTALTLADEHRAGTGDSAPLGGMILQRWAEFDAPAACEAAHKRGQNSLTGTWWLNDPLRVWAARDPQAALTWFRQNAQADQEKKVPGESSRPASCLSGIMGAWALRDMDAAMQAFHAMTGKNEIGAALAGFSEVSGNLPGRTAVLDAILAKTDDSGDAWRSVSRALFRWNTSQPAELAAWLDRNSVPAIMRHSVSMPLLMGWLREDAPAAVDWWFKTPNSPKEQDQRMETLVNAWAEVDIPASAEWLAAQKLDATAAGSMQTLATMVARRDPERGFAWALQIPEEENRNNALRGVVSAWARRDRTAATAAINAAALDDARKTELLKTIDTP